ncbi:MAG TPA: cupin domain-containing protein [Bradyrhizobium sp.]|jgi:mannose-6-phosphate isomerase-like protein (cupin superfamily)|nr:cupin domain-containing protein [Bradyrhizobium sp.]
MIRQVFWSTAAILIAGSAATASDIRRVVTGLDERNHAVVLFDSPIPLKQDSPVISSTNFWITDSTPPNLSKQDTSNRPIGVSPPDNGTKFRLVEFAPLDSATEAKLPPEMIMKGVNHPPEKGIPVKHPMMHRTRSLDYAVILSGEIDMMLDDTSVHLKQGDVIVQQATNHAWVNHGVQPCRILFVLMDSKEP